jgi:hypothetical protein
MRRLLLILSLIAFAVWGMSACKPGLLPTEDAGKPKVTLERVEIVSYFPWTDLPARTPLILGYVFNIDNPSGYDIKLENFKFSTFFEAVPGEYLSISTPTTYDTMYFPPKTVSQYRVVNVMDSAVINLSLLVPNAPKMQALKLKSADVIKDWYTKIQDFAFGIKVGEGQATFSTEKGDVIVPFEGKFPKK